MRAATLAQQQRIQVHGRLSITQRRTVSRLTSDSVGDSGPARVEIRGQIWTAWAAIAAVPLAATWADPDLGGHVRYGLDILRDRALSAIDPYSFTQDRPWINHEWLSEAMMAAAYSVLGPQGLILLKGTLAALTLVLVQRAYRRASPISGVTVLTLALLSALSITFTVRPQLWSMLALALLVAIVNRSEPPTLRRVACSAALFALWANLHGGWLVGAGLLAMYGAVRAWRVAAERARWLLLMSASFAATLVNPYGVGLWGLLATTVRPSRPEITEWQPLGSETSLLHWLPVVSLAVIWVFLMLRKRDRPPLEVSVALWMLLLGALRALRIGPLIAPAALMLLAPSLSRVLENLGRVAVAGKAPARLMWVPVVVVLMAVARPIAAVGRCIDMRGAWVPDRHAAASLKETSGRLWTTFGWGQYSNWQFGPRLRVSIDGRLEVYSDAVRDLHRNFENGDERARQTFLSLAPDYVWLPARLSDVKSWLTTQGYRIDVDTAESFVAARKTLPPLQQGRAPLPDCFE